VFTLNLDSGEWSPLLLGEAFRPTQLESSSSEEASEEEDDDGGGGGDNDDDDDDDDDGSGSAGAGGDDGEREAESEGKSMAPAELMPEPSVDTAAAAAAAAAVARDGRVAQLSQPAGAGCESAAIVNPSDRCNVRGGGGLLVPSARTSAGAVAVDGQSLVVWGGLSENAQGIERPTNDGWELAGLLGGSGSVRWRRLTVTAQ
jgi:hypothetical protein